MPPKKTTHRVFFTPKQMVWLRREARAAEVPVSHFVRALVARAMGAKP